MRRPGSAARGTLVLVAGVLGLGLGACGRGDEDGAATARSAGGGGGAVVATRTTRPAPTAARPHARGHLPGRARLRAGGTVRLPAGRYGIVDLHGLRPRTPLTLAGAGPSTRLRAVDLDAARDVTVRGVLVTGGVHIGAGAARVALRDSTVTRRGIVVRRSRGVRIVHVRVHDIALLGRGEGDGFGLWVRGQGDGAAGGTARDLVVSRTCFAHLPDDGIHLSAVAGVTVLGSEFLDIFPSVDPSIHADAIQVHDAARDVHVTRSWFHDTNRGIIVKDDIYPGFVVRGDVFERMKAWALDLYDAPGVVIADNVVRDHPGSSVLLHEQHGQMRDAVVTGNQLLRWSFERGEVAREGANRIAAPAAGSPYAVDDILGMPPPPVTVPAAMRACANAPA